MPRITLADYRVLQAGLRDLYAHHNLDTLPHAALRLTHALVPSDVCAYNEIDPSQQRLQAVFAPERRQREISPLLPFWERYMDQHPVLKHFRLHPADGPKKISDFLSDQQFRETDLYREFFSKIGIRYQMVVGMPSPAPLVVGLAVNRGQQDFSARDRALLGAIQPHLRQAYENAALITELTHQVLRSNTVLDRIDRGVIAIDATGRVKQASSTAIRYLAEYFGSEAEASLVRRLPSQLANWVREQIVSLRQSDTDPTPPLPMILPRGKDRLVIRIVTDHQEDHYLIIIRLARALDSPDPLRGLGLTSREAEVLFWLISGHTNRQIADSAYISERTVDKHCQNIYSKLRVAGRTEAVTHALEWLRL